METIVNVQECRMGKNEVSVHQGRTPPTCKYNINTKKGER